MLAFDGKKRENARYNLVKDNRGGNVVIRNVIKVIKI